jgi:Putative MetA-pathway of phenol degradation
MARARSAGRITVLFVCLTLLAPWSLQAQQTDQKLSEIIGTLYLETSLIEAVAIASTVGTVDIDALRLDLRRQLAAALTMNNLVGAQVSSFPLGSSAGGFSWTFDPALGSFSRVSPSFGPVFSERALTIGRRRLNVGINYQRGTFDGMEGKDLRGGDIQFYQGRDFGPFSIFFEDSLDLKMSTDTVGLFATYGVTDRLDLGIAIPIMNVEMRAVLTTRIGNDIDGVDPEPVFAPQVVNDSASGIGDIVIRGKYNLWKARGGGLAAGVDWRLPTGDEEELLGIAGAQGKFYLAASTAYGKVSPHFNLGLTVSGDTEAARSDESFVYRPPDEVGYAVGVDFALTPRLTVVGDIVGRTLRDTDEFDLRLTDVPTEFGASYREWDTQSGSLKLLLGSVGVKFNPVSRSLISFNLLFPLNDRGLRDDVTIVGGFEWSF